MWKDGEGLERIGKGEDCGRWGRMREDGGGWKSVGKGRGRWRGRMGEDGGRAEKGREGWGNVVKNGGRVGIEEWGRMGNDGKKQGWIGKGREW